MPARRHLCALPGEDQPPSQLPPPVPQGLVLEVCASAPPNNTAFGRFPPSAPGASGATLRGAGAITGGPHPIRLPLRNIHFVDSVPSFQVRFTPSAPSPQSSPH